ncbi:MAG: hypothetical protein ACO3B3_12105 [Cyanobium sp.]
MPQSNYVRSALGENLFFHIACEDPTGPRFDRSLVARADRLTYRLIESEQRHGESVEWALYAGAELLAERIFDPGHAPARP